MSLDTLPLWHDLPVPDYSGILDDADSNARASGEDASSPANSSPSPSSSNAAAAMLGLTPPAQPAASVHFPVNPALNRKLTLTRGDILGLKVDAVVNSTNERLSDLHATSLGRRLCLYAGPAFRTECQSLVRVDGGVATGDSCLMSSHALGMVHGAATHVIHTVSPRYTPKYHVAAENALHGCIRRSLELLLDAGLHTIAFPLVHSAKKLYPPEEAAHVVLRTLRKFLERYGEHTLQRVVLCLQDSEAEQAPQHHPSLDAGYPAGAPHPSDDTDVFALYERILPLYFPRNEEEARLQERFLPAHTGDELGEVVVDERRIRIQYGQFIAQGPTPYTDEQRAEVQRHAQAAIAAQQQAKAAAAGSDVTAASSSSSSSSPSRRRPPAIVPAPPLPNASSYPSPSEYPVEPQHVPLAPRSSDPIVPSADAFSSASEDPDAVRQRAFLAAMSPAEREAEMAERHRYFQALNAAHACDDPHMLVLDSTRYLYEDRPDVLGRRILHVVGARVPLYRDDGAERVSLQHLTHHVLRNIDPIAMHSFIAVYWHAGVEANNRSVKRQSHT